MKKKAHGRPEKSTHDKRDGHHFDGRGSNLYQGVSGIHAFRAFASRG
jgi:hypothetical protein